jgi:hypothetical protein
MYKWSFVCLGIAILVVPTNLRADDQDDIKAILAKAIKAQGGEEKLAKEHPVTLKIKGKFYGLGGDEGIDYTLNLANTSNKRRMELETSGFKFIQVYNGEKGWKKINDDVMDMDKDDIAEAKEQIYQEKVGTLVPLLKDKEFKLTSLGEAKIDKKPAVGIKVSSKDHRDIDLFFDKTTGLLVKTETTVKDMGQEYKQESIMSDYKDFDGHKVPMKIVINRDGKKFVDGETLEYKQHDKLDDNVFGKP